MAIWISHIWSDFTSWDKTIILYFESACFQHYTKNYSDIAFVRCSIKMRDSETIDFEMKRASVIVMVFADLCMA